MAKNLVYGVGVYELGEYPAKVNGKHNAAYKCWQSMLRRIYDEPFQEKWPTYKGCTVCDDWKNYQTFAKWYWAQKCAGLPKTHLDKDIIKKGNKHYCPEYCSLIPESVNTIFEKQCSVRGKYPAGVTKIDNGYVSRVRARGSRVYLGYYKTPEEAFQAYKVAKEVEVKRVANLHKDYLDSTTYDALMAFKANIED